MQVRCTYVQVYTFIHEHKHYMIRIYENMHIRMYTRTKAQTNI